MEKAEQSAGVPQQEQPQPQSPEQSPEQLEVNREAESSKAQERQESPETEAPSQEARAQEESATPQTPVIEKDELRMQVERALEDKLWEIYLALPADSRQRFKEGGELCATELRQMVEKSKVRPRHVVGPIKKWLKLIPHVNSWFLYQEAKIKTDKFMRLHGEHQEGAASVIE